MPDPNTTPKADVLPSIEALAQLDTLESEIEKDLDDRLRAQREAKSRLIEKHRIHTGAFELARKLKSMEPPKRHEWIKHMLHYLEAMGLDKQTDLFDVPLTEQIATMSQVGHREGLGQSRT